MTDPVPQPRRTILFPGLGTDQRLYARQRAALPFIETPAWLTPQPRETLREYATRWGRELGVDHSCVVGGVSMGGMVAIEVARAHAAGAAVLLGSCRHPRSILPIMRVFERIGRWTPDLIIDKGRLLAPLLVGRGGLGLNKGFVGVIPPDDRRLLARMVNELPVSFIRWAARAVMEWPGCEDPGPGVRVVHVHGEHDWVIPLSRVRATRVVPRGAHVLNLSHPDAVNDALREAAFFPPLPHSGQATPATSPASE